LGIPGLKGFYYMKKGLFTFSVRDIVEIAMLCAIAVLLDTFIKIQVGATGGSVNIAMVPLFVIALRHGWFKGFVAGGIVFGLITCAIDGYGFACYPLEYLVAFGAVGIAGIFGEMINNLMDRKSPKKVVIAYIILIGLVAVISTIRFFAASIDSVILWDYEWAAAFGYNAPYVYFSAIAVGVVLCALLPMIKVVNNLYPTNYLKDNNKEER
jgi:thiamine transporter